MIPVVTAAEAVRMDERSADSVDVLMDRAGRAVARAVLGMGVGYGSTVAVLCGPGNNGGDGYVAARHLQARGAGVQVLTMGEPKTPEAQAAAALARAHGISVRPLGRVLPVDVVVDALFGGGAREGLPREVKRWFEVGAPVVAVDVPTGVHPDTGQVPDGSFRAAVTVTFGAYKQAHVYAPERCGRVEVVDIGLGPGDAVLLAATAGDAPRPKRSPDDHKWSVGSVLVVGGSPGMVGAAVMAGRAALHFGAGGVGIASAVQSAVTLLAPELLTYGLKRIPYDRYDVVVLGPGLGDRPEVVEQVLDQAGRVVVDADALRDVEALRHARAEMILTPHGGEFARLAQTEPDPTAAEELARKLNATVLLKGSPTIVTDVDVPWVVTSGGPELATIGTGDVLAGMVAALWARGLDAPAAARSAAYWHGVAGADLAKYGAVTADRLARHVGRFVGYGRPSKFR